MDRLPEALRYAERAVALRPDSAGARNNLGNILRAMGRRDDAIAQYESALGIDPNFFMAHYNCGVALRGETRIAEARAHFARAFALKPDFLEAEFAVVHGGASRRSTTVHPRSPSGAPPMQAGWRGCPPMLTAAGVPPRAGGGGRLASAILPALSGSERPRAAGLVRFAGVQGSGGEISDGGAAKPAGPDQPIRLGIVSGFFRQHSNWKIPIKGWLENARPEPFSVSGYYTGAERESETDGSGGDVRSFRPGPVVA